MSGSSTGAVAGAPSAPVAGQDKQRLLDLAATIERNEGGWSLLTDAVGDTIGADTRYEHPGSENPSHRPYLTNIDDAKRVVPAGWNWATGTRHMGEGGHAYLRHITSQHEIAVDAANPAAALTAAGLRARAHGGTQ